MVYYDSKTPERPPLRRHQNSPSAKTSISEILSIEKRCGSVAHGLHFSRWPVKNILYACYIYVSRGMSEPMILTWTASWICSCSTCLPSSTPVYRSLVIFLFDAIISRTDLIHVTGTWEVESTSAFKKCTYQVRAHPGVNVTIELATVGTAVSTLILSHHLPRSLNGSGLTDTAGAKFDTKAEKKLVDVVVMAGGETKTNCVNNVQVSEDHDSQLGGESGEGCGSVFLRIVLDNARYDCRGDLKLVFVLLIIFWCGVCTGLFIIARQLNWAESWSVILSARTKSVTRSRARTTARRSR